MVLVPYLRIYILIRWMDLPNRMADIGSYIAGQDYDIVFLQVSLSISAGRYIRTGTYPTITEKFSPNRIKSFLCRLPTLPYLHNYFYHELHESDLLTPNRPGCFHRFLHHYHCHFHRLHFTLVCPRRQFLRRFIRRRHCRRHCCYFYFIFPRLFSSSASPDFVGLRFDF